MLYLFNRILPYLSSLLIGITFVIWTVHPGLAWYCGIALAVITILSLWSLTSVKGERSAFWQFLSTPFALIASAFLYYFIVDNELLRPFFIGGVMVIFTLIQKNIFAFMHHTEQYQPYALENIYGYVNMLSLFLFYAGCYGLALLLAWPFWLITIFIFVITSLLFMRTLWSYKVPWQQSKLYVLLVGVVVAQGAYVIYSLPTGFLVDAFWLIAIYYVLMNVIKDYLKETMTLRRTRMYLILSGLAIVITMLTTKWQ